MQEIEKEQVGTLTLVVPFGQMEMREEPREMARLEKRRVIMFIRGFQFGPGTRVHNIIHGRALENWIL